MSSCGILIMSMGALLRSKSHPEMLISFPRGSGNRLMMYDSNKGEAHE